MEGIDWEFYGVEDEEPDEETVVDADETGLTTDDGLARFGIQVKHV